MNKYDLSWEQPVAKSFIMENDQLLEGYREKLNNPENDPNNSKYGSISKLHMKT